MRSLTSLVVHLCLTGFHLGQVLSAPANTSSPSILYVTKRELGDDIPYPPGYSTDTCPAEAVNEWEKIDVNGSIVNIYQVEVELPPPDDPPIEPKTGLLPVNIKSRQNDLCRQIASHTLQKQKDTFRTIALTLGRSPTYFLSWEVDGGMMINMWTRKQGQNWKRERIEHGEILQGSVQLDIQGSTRVSFDFSIRPNDHGGVSGEIALFRENRMPGSSTEIVE